MPQPLSSKDGALFRQVVRNCENKQYKKGAGLPAIQDGNAIELPPHCSVICGSDKSYLGI